MEQSTISTSTKEGANPNQPLPKRDITKQGVYNLVVTKITNYLFSHKTNDPIE